jgi:hypothetical protein
MTSSSQERVGYFEKRNKKQRFNDEINYQRFLASPYSAHLNFKTFENFFDVEICGEKETNGRTIYKLRKINPWRRTYSQNMLLWMLQ